MPSSASSASSTSGSSSSLSSSSRKCGVYSGSSSSSSLMRICGVYLYLDSGFGSVGFGGSVGRSNSGGLSRS